ncbi:hypothetical protein BH10ACT3_BH10ACT3_12490 [soil metagenome]
MLGLLAQSDSGSSAAGAGILVVVYLAFFVIYLVAMWKLFVKMGQPGWQGIIPLLNAYVIFKLAGKEWWWVILLIIPCINIIAAFILAQSTAKLFAKEIGWTIFLFLLPGLAHLVLAFGSAQYAGPQEKAI